MTKKDLEKEVSEREVPEIKIPEPEIEQKEDEKQKSTTIKLSPETHARLTKYKKIAHKETFDDVLNYLIDNNPDRKSDEKTVFIELTRSQFTWLCLHQTKCDCRRVLERSVR